MHNQHTWEEQMSEKKNTKITTVLSRNNPLLRRALNNQSSDESDEISTSEKHEILLLVRGMVERLVVKNDEVFRLGRFEFSSNPREVDLTPYGAADRGVSREHAQIHIKDNQVYITDLNSTNGTFVQGERLDPNTPKVIKKGNELLLGRLAVQVMFR